MREGLAVFAYLYVFLMYVAYYSLQDGCETFSQSWFSAGKHMIGRRALLSTLLIGLPIYFISYYSLWFAAALTLTWLVLWIRKLMQFIND